MPGNATHHEAVVVVHEAARGSLAGSLAKRKPVGPRAVVQARIVDLRRGDRGGRQRHESRKAELERKSERARDTIREQLIEACATELLEPCTEEQESEIGVDRLRAWRRRQGHAPRRSDELVARTDVEPPGF